MTGKPEESTGLIKKMADLQLTFKKNPHIALRPFDHMDYPLLSVTSLNHFNHPTCVKVLIEGKLHTSGKGYMFYYNYKVFTISR